MSRTKSFKTLSALMLTCISAFAQSSTDNPDILSRLSSGTNSNEKNVVGSDLIQKDLSHGNANISIPLYEYTLSGLDLGVRLTYNTNGIQVDRVASEIGLGWELQTGGFIDREIAGAPDDVKAKPCCFRSSSPQRALEYGTETNLPGMYGNWVSNTNENPDLLMAYFAGRFIKFMFHKNPNEADPNVMTIPSSGIKMDVVTLGEKGAHTSIVIKDEFGNQFFYVKGKKLDLTEAIDYNYKSNVDLPGGTPCGEYTNNICVQESTPIIRWVIDRIVTYEGAEIKYHYGYDNVSLATHWIQRYKEKVGSNWCAVDKDEIYEKPCE